MQVWKNHSTGSKDIPLTRHGLEKEDKITFKLGTIYLYKFGGNQSTGS